MKKFFKRLTETERMLLCFIPFGAICFYFNGWVGLFGAAVGWWLGSVIYHWQDSKRKIKKFFSTYTEIKVKAIIVVPVAAACTYHSGWSGFFASLAGIAVGEFICRRYLFKKQ